MAETQQPLPSHKDREPAVPIFRPPGQTAKQRGERTGRPSAGSPSAPHTGPKAAAETGERPLKGCLRYEHRYRSGSVYHEA